MVSYHYQNGPLVTYEGLSMPEHDHNALDVFIRSSYFTAWLNNPSVASLTTGLLRFVGLLGLKPNIEESLPQVQLPLPCAKSWKTRVFFKDCDQHQLWFLSTGKQWLCGK